MFEYAASHKETGLPGKSTRWGSLPARMRREFGIILRETRLTLDVSRDVGYTSRRIRVVGTHVDNVVMKLISTIWLPLFALAALASFYGVWFLFDLPPKDEVIRMAQEYYDAYGLITVFISAIIEGVLLAGWYFPGSLVIVLGVVFAGRDIPQLLGVFVATTLGFLISYTFNFYIGKYGWYRLIIAFGFRGPLEKAQKQLATYGPRAVFLTYWHPNLAALTSTAAGILQIPFRTFLFYSVVAAFVWDVFWVMVGYAFGEISIDLIGPKFVLPFIAIWIAIILAKRIRSAKKENAEQLVQPSELQ